jgi:hypothetical protein
MELAIENMGQFNKEDLCYSYKWQSEAGTYARTKKTLNRTNGSEVLEFINEFFSSHNLSSAGSFKRTEYLLYNHLPINIKNKTEITSWLLKNWDSHSYIK